MPSLKIVDKRKKKLYTNYILHNNLLRAELKDHRTYGFENFHSSEI